MVTFITGTCQRFVFSHRVNEFTLNRSGLIFWRFNLRFETYVLSSYRSLKEGEKTDIVFCSSFGKKLFLETVKEKFSHVVFWFTSGTGFPFLPGKTLFLYWGENLILD